MIQGNLIGTDVSGSVAVGNRLSGIVVVNATGTLIGTDGDGSDDASESNVISANNYGIQFSSANENVISGNLIGTDVSGSQSLGNLFAGLYFSSSNDNQIGGLLGSTGNLISGNVSDGISLTQSSQNTITGNLIGTTRGGLASLGEQDRGIFVSQGVGNIIGGLTADQRNVISGHEIHGVEITGFNGQFNQVIGNYIGVGLDGETAVANLGDGVRLSNATKYNLIGVRPTAGTGLGNVISGNRSSGVTIDNSSGTSHNVIEGNVIGLNSASSRAIPNAGDSGGGGVVIGSSYNQVIDNIISGNAASGIVIASSIDQAYGNTITSNLIGTTSTGLSSLPNDGFGISIQQGRSNTIGGVTDSDRNVISGNTDDNIRIENASSQSNVVIGNFIGVGIDGFTIVSPPGGAGGDGIDIVDAAYNRIGGSSLAERNVISGNRNHGIQIRGTTAITDAATVVDARANTVRGNAIGTDIEGRVDLGNGQDGIHLVDTQDNQIGGSTASGRKHHHLQRNWRDGPRRRDGEFNPS